MSIRRPLEENTSISSGGSSTSVPLALSNDSDTTLQFEGDADSINLTFIIQARVDPTDNWGRLDILENIDLTEAVNNTKIFQYDTLDLEELRVVTENGATSTNLSIIASKSEQQ